MAKLIRFRSAQPMLQGDQREPDESRENTCTRGPLTAQLAINGLCCALVVCSLRGVLFAQLAPDEELKRLRAADDLEVELFAAEPLVTNPAAIDIDTHGRVWVAEIQFYRKDAKTPPADKIKVLEDTDGDGRADRATVFADGLFCPMSVCVAGSKVYVATSPDLWVFEDTNNDLVADGPPTKLLTGFGGYNHDHGAHSLVLGPDHKWYMSHGDGGFDLRGTDGSRVQYQWGAVLRGELDGSNLETLAVNFRNPYEACVSSFGEVFLSDNDNDGNQSTRICWILEGGDYGWFGQPPARVSAPVPFAEHWHFRGHLPGFVPATLVTGFGSPCGICFYEGESLGEAYRDAPIHADAGPREVRMFRHQLRGFGYKASRTLLLTSQGDDYFRPDDVCAAPDGSLYVSDWYDGGVGGHAYNNPGQGRIFRLKRRGQAPRRVEQPGPYRHVDDAVTALASPNLATQFLAREKLLAAPAESTGALTALLPVAPANLRARALWVLDRLGGDARADVVKLLSDKEERFRALGVRILRRHGAEYADQILELAHDPAASVRREVLLACAQIDTPAALEVLIEQAKSSDGSDRYLVETVSAAAGERKAALFKAVVGSERAPARDLDLLLALDSERAVQLMAKKLHDPATDAAQKQGIVARLSAHPGAAEAVWQTALDPQADTATRQAALAAIQANINGEWSGIASREAFAAELQGLLGEPATAIAAVRLAMETQATALGPALVEVIKRKDIADDLRQDSMRAVAVLKAPGAADSLRPLLAEKSSLADTAVSAIVRLQDWNVLGRILADDELPIDARKKVIDELFASSSTALAMSRRLDNLQISPELRARAVQLGAGHADANVRMLFERHVPADQRQARLGTQVTAEQILSLAGDATRGREVFLRSTAAQCNKCHAVGGEGSELGPDLSQIGKKYERKTLLETILEPSKAIAPEYVPYVVATKSGQLYAGFVVQRDKQKLVLKDAENQRVRIPLDEIESIEAQSKSMMPELVFRDASAQDAADLLAYLKSLGTTAQ